MKRVLLTVCGLTPQVITETLFALHAQGRMVDAIRVITTRLGKEACHAHLLTGPDGRYFRFLDDYGIPADTIDFTSRHIHTVADDAGRELDDIASEEDNAFFLTACMEATFELTQDPGREIFFSIAGGRKTMGACLTVAAQFYGRPQDRLFHVLISPEFESNRDFYYPPPESVPVTLFDRKGQPYSKETRFAAVELVPLPFISVRDRISDRLLKKVESPAGLLLSMVREQRQVLQLDLPAGKLVWKGVELDMMPARLALYAFFILKKKDSTCARDSCGACRECFLDLPAILDAQEEIAELYRKIAQGRQGLEMSDTGITQLSAENFNSYKSKIRRDLERAFGPYEMPRLEIASSGRRPGLRYGIPLERGRLRVIL